MAKRPKDPCQRQACAIQDCLKKHQFQEEKCQEVLQQMLECCKTVEKGSSYICLGMKDYDTSKTALTGFATETQKII